MAGELGFEPRLTESESAVLPLNYSPPNCTINSLNSQFCKSASAVLQIWAQHASICGPLCSLSSPSQRLLTMRSRAWPAAAISIWSRNRM
jgi:hypothetical protein